MVPVDNILFASEMVGAVKGIDPKTGFNFDDTKRYVDNAPKLSDADRHKIFEGNARRVFSRLKTESGVKGGGPGFSPHWRKLRQRKPRQRKSQVVRFGHREIETQGLDQGFWTDLYHRAMTVYWPVFFGSAAAIFIGLNSMFAGLYYLGDDPVANAGRNGPLELFYFSIETLATVGYGDMHPQTDYGHFIATIEIFTGMCFLAV